MRENKIKEKDSKKPPQKTTEQLLEIVLEDVIKTATLSFEDWRSLSPSPFGSFSIRLKSGDEYRITQVGHDASHALARQTWRVREDFRQTLERDEFDKLAFSAIAQTIKGSREHLPKLDSAAESSEVGDDFFVALARDYCVNLDGLVNEVRADLDQHIFCDLFHSDQNVPAFKVGPVSFRPRAEWIDAFVTNPAELTIVRQVEAGTLTMGELREQSLACENEHSLYNARSLLKSLGGFGWVATLRMQAHEIKRSHEKASIIVGLAIDALGLRFSAGDARHFVKAGQQHLFSEERLATSVDGVFRRGTKIQMPGLGSRPGALAEKMTSERNFLEAAGRILDAYMEGRQVGRAPHLIERWTNALYWVGEARRETNDFMALVKYGCAADGLSGAGGDASRMTNFAQAALNPKDEPSTPGKISIEHAVTMVYREGRNKLAHGESPGLLEDLVESRAVGDELLQYLFDSVTFELAKVIKIRPEILSIGEDNAYRAFKERLRQRS